MITIRAAVAAALVLGNCAVPVVAAETTAGVAQSRPLDAALRDLARRSGLQIIYVTDATRGINVASSDQGGIPEQALTKLLDGTDLTFEFLNERTVEIRSRASAVPTVRAASYQTIEPSGQVHASGAPATASDALEEVIVTARKREERLLDVPIAVTAFNGESLARRGVNSVSDFLQEAPSVSVYPSAGLFRISIRGTSTSLGSNENGYYLDELPFTGVTVPLNPDVRAWDLERVEVLRGPQGTLFGEGSLGGTVRILTRDPQFNEWQGQVSVGASDTASGGGTNEAYKGMLNVPVLDDRLALRLGATKENIDGWITDPVTGKKGINTQDIETYRIKLRFQATERFSIAASYWKYSGEFPRDNTADDQGRAGTGLALASETNYELYGASADYDFDGFTIHYTYAKNRFELPQSGELFGGQLIGNIAIDVDSNELRASSSGDGALQWTVGAYRRQADRNDAFIFDLFAIDNLSVTDSTSEALFGEVTYASPSVPVDLTLGLRSVREKLKGVETNAGVAEPGVSKTYSSTNPRVVVAWRPNDAWRVYASAAKGYRSGQLQPSVSLALAGTVGIDLPATLADDSIWTYEIGTKGIFAGERAFFEAAVYHSDWNDVTVRIPIGNTGFNGLINSDGTTTDGVEASLTMQLNEAWRVNLMASYADATYAGAVPGTGIKKGRPVDDTSKTTAAASVEYRAPVFGRLTGSARLGGQYNSERDFPSFGPPLYLPGDSITTLSARVGLEGAWWGAFLFADNLTNEDGATSPRNVVVPGETPPTANRLQPRTIGLEFRMGFGGR